MVSYLKICYTSINKIVLLLRVSGGIWPLEAPATAYSDVLIPTVLSN